MSQNIGVNYSVTVPSLSDDASVVQAFQYYHSGSLEPDVFTNDSIEYHLGTINGRIDTNDTDISSIDSRVIVVEDALGENPGFLPDTYVNKVPSALVPNIIQPDTTTVVPLTIQGVNSQTADLQQWKTSSGTVAKVTSNGTLYSYNGVSIDQVVTVAGSQTLSLKTLSSPSMTGTPTAPTPSNSTNSTQVATTAFVKTAIATVDINTYTSSVTLSSVDTGKLLYINNSFNVGITVPPDTSYNFPVGTTISAVRAGAVYDVYFVEGAGVTVNSTPGKYLRTQWSAATLTKVAANTWVLFGDLMV